MKRIACVTAFAFVLVLAIAGCHFANVHGSGIRKTEKRELASFKAIDTTGAYEVEVICQKPVAFEIEADDNLLPLIQTDVRDGVLYVRSDKPYNSRKAVTLRISIPNLERIKSTGAGKFHIADVKNDKFAIDSTGASNVTALGETKNLQIHSTGAGKIDASQLHAQRADVSSSGVASVDVNASDQLDVNVSGAGRVSYSGDPKVNKNVSGAGVVSKRD